MRWFDQTPKNYGFISESILNKLVRMHTNHLAMKQLLLKIAELEISKILRRTVLFPLVEGTQGI